MQFALVAKRMGRNVQIMAWSKTMTYEICSKKKGFCKKKDKREKKIIGKSKKKFTEPKGQKEVGLKQCVYGQKHLTVSVCSVDV